MAIANRTARNTRIQLPAPTHAEIRSLGSKFSRGRIAFPQFLDALVPEQTEEVRAMQQDLVYSTLRRYGRRAITFRRLCDEIDRGPSTVMSALQALRAAGRVVGYRVV